MKHKPAFILNVNTPPGTFDVNISPDKREIVLTNEEIIFDRLKEAVCAEYDSSRYTFQVNTPSSSQVQLSLDAFSSTQSSVPSTIVSSHQNVQENQTIHHNNIENAVLAKEERVTDIGDNDLRRSSDRKDYRAKTRRERKSVVQIDSFSESSSAHDDEVADTVELTAADDVDMSSENESEVITTEDKSIKSGPGDCSSDLTDQCDLKRCAASLVSEVSKKRMSSVWEFSPEATLKRVRRSRESIDCRMKLVDPLLVSSTDSSAVTSFLAARDGEAGIRVLRKEVFAFLLCFH